MTGFPKFFIFLSVTAALFLLVSPDLPEFVFTTAKVVLFFSVVSIIVIFITNPYSFGLFSKKVAKISKNIYRMIFDRDMYLIDKEFEEDEDVLDITQMNMNDLLKNINNYVKNPAPLTLAGKDMVNQHLKMDMEKMQILQANLSQLKDTSFEMSETKASVLFDPEMTEYFMKNNDAMFAQNLEMKEAEHTSKIKEIEAESEQKQLEVEQSKLELEKEQAEIDRRLQEVEYQKQEVAAKRAEIERYVEETREYLDIDKHIDLIRSYADMQLQQARTIREIDLAEFFKQFVAEANFKDMPEHLKTYLLQVIINPRGQAKEVNDFELIEEIKDFNIKELKRKERMGEYDVDMKRNARDRDKSQTEVDKQHSKEIINELKSALKDKNRKN
jgi:hypothetical protein